MEYAENIFTVEVDLKTYEAGGYSPWENVFLSPVKVRALNRRKFQRLCPQSVCVSLSVAFSNSNSHSVCSRQAESKVK